MSGAFSYDETWMRSPTASVPNRASGSWPTTAPVVRSCVPSAPRATGPWPVATTTKPMPGCAASIASRPGCSRSMSVRVSRSACWLNQTPPRLPEPTTMISAGASPGPVVSVVTPDGPTGASWSRSAIARSVSRPDTEACPDSCPISRLTGPHASTSPVAAVTAASPSK